jgi:transposase
MGTASIHEGVRRMRFSSLLDRQDRGEITQEEEAEMLGVHVRTFQRWAARYEEEGEAGLADRRLGGASPRRAPQQELERMLGLYRDRYADFTVKHFHEQLVKRHDYKLGYTLTKLTLHAAGLVKPARSRSAHRKKRQRRPLPGMMLHQDGSRHVWIEGCPPMDLIVTLDDATSASYSMILVEEEGTASTFRALREVIAKYGLFCALYTDRGGHYFYTPKDGEKVSRTHKTQVGRALAQLGIEPIPSYSPQARGRIACPKNCGSPASTMSRPPTSGCASIISTNTTRPSRSRRSRQGAPSCRIAPKPGARFSASSRSAPSVTTTRSPGPGSGCSCRKAGCGRISSRPACGCTNIPTTP